MAAAIELSNNTWVKSEASAAMGATQASNTMKTIRFSKNNGALILSKEDTRQSLPNTQKYPALAGIIYLA